jgi:hypothetical protein
LRCGPDDHTLCIYLPAAATVTTATSDGEVSIIHDGETLIFDGETIIFDGENIIYDGEVVGHYDGE